MPKDGMALEVLCRGLEGVACGEEEAQKQKDTQLWHFAVPDEGAYLTQRRNRAGWNPRAAHF